MCLGMMLKKKWEQISCQKGFFFSISCPVYKKPSSFYGSHNVPSKLIKRHQVKTTCYEPYYWARVPVEFQTTLIFQLLRTLRSFFAAGIFACKLLIFCEDLARDGDIESELLCLSCFICLSVTMSDDGGVICHAAGQHKIYYGSLDKRLSNSCNSWVLVLWL